MLTNLVIVLIIAVIVTGAAAKLINDRRKGSPCSGCPYSGFGNQHCQAPADHLPCDPGAESNQ